MHRTAGTGAFCSSWRYRFLNFTHIAPRTIGLLLLSGLSLLNILSFSLSPNHSLPIFRSRSHRRRKPPIVLYSETSFCFILPSFPSLSCSLSLYGLLYIYALSSVPFVHANCSHGQTSNPIRCERRGERSEEGRTNPVKRRESRTIAEKKMRQWRG